MTIVLVIVAIGWVVFLGSVVKERMGTRVGDSVHSFHSQLSTLERRVGPRRARPSGFSTAPLAFSPGRQPMSPQAQRRAARQAEFRRRRRDVLFGLVGVFAFSLLLVAISPGPITALACIAIAALLAGYVYLLVQVERNATERRAKVSYLNDRRSAASVAPAHPELMLRRSASN